MPGPSTTTTARVPTPTSAPRSQADQGADGLEGGVAQRNGTGGSKVSAATSVGPAPVSVLR